MDIKDALKAFDSLSQETRLEAFRLLVEHGTNGISAGKLSEELGIPHNTLSFHLSHMSNAGIIDSRRKGRSIIYSANLSSINDLVLFLIKDCCKSDAVQVKGSDNKDCMLIDIESCCD